jgi:hypothetical protein
MPQCASMLERQSGDVTARTRQARNEAAADGVSRHSKNDRNHRLRLKRHYGPAWQIVQAATGKRVEVPFVAIVRFEGDKIAHEHLY